MNTLDRIKKIRLLKGFSQEYMAYHLNISQKSYSKFERSSKSVSPKRLKEIAEIFEMEVKDILDFKIEMTPSLNKLDSLELEIRFIKSVVMQIYDFVRNSNGDNIFSRERLLTPSSTSPPDSAPTPSKQSPPPSAPPPAAPASPTARRAAR